MQRSLVLSLLAVPALSVWMDASASAGMKRSLGMGGLDFRRPDHMMKRHQKKTELLEVSGNATATPSAVPTMSPVTIIPTFKEHCPTGKDIWVRTTDSGKYSYTDVAGLIFDLVDPDKIDNAGFYKSGGWDRMPEIEPTRDLLMNEVYPAGYVTPVLFKLYDQYGNEQFCHVNVHVLDDEAPSFTFCPSDDTVDTNAGICAATYSWSDPTTTDNDNLHPLTLRGPLIDDTIITSDSFPTGIHHISYTVVDHNGNNATCEFALTVLDGESPTFGVCESNVETYQHKCGAIGSEAGTPVSWGCAADDNCDTSVTPVCNPWVEIVGMHAFHPEQTHMGSATSVMCLEDIDSALQYCENQGSTFCLTERDGDQECAKGFETVSQEDFFDEKYRLFIYKSSGDSFPIPPKLLHENQTLEETSYKVTCDVVDAATNKNSHTFKFDVVDARRKPHFTYCPTNISIDLPANPNIHTISPNFTEPQFAHQGGCDVTLTEERGMDASTQLAAGVHLYEYTATDEGGNTATCIFQVTVLDKNGINWRDCPSAKITYETDVDLLQYAIANWTVPVPTKRGLDLNETAVIVHHPDAEPGMAFPLGITKVTYSLTDKREHMDAVVPEVCEFEVEVTDKEKPEFTGKAAIPDCGAEAGVPKFSFCGGKYINVEKPADTEEFYYKTNTNYTVSEVPVMTCCAGNTCQEFPGSNGLVKVCM